MILLCVSCILDFMRIVIVNGFAFWAMSEDVTQANQDLCSFSWERIEVWHAEALPRTYFGYFQYGTGGT